MHRGGTLIIGLALAAALVPATVQAQDPAANDPKPGSPSGAVYEIPLDRARADAAPRTPAGEGTAPAPPAAGSSPIRSANGFGSSSEVPGVPASEAGGSDGGKRSRPSQRGDTRSGEARRGGEKSGSGSGEAAAEGGTAGATAERLITASAEAPAQPSSTRAFLLIVLGVAVAAGLGVAARRTMRGR